MSKAVKLADIGKQLGVSTVTVSKALSGQRGVSEELRAKIRQLADEMGYVKSTQDKSKERRSHRGCSSRTLSRRPVFFLSAYVSGTVPKSDAKKLFCHVGSDQL